MKINFCTYFDSAYADKGWVCYHTLMAQNQNAMLYIICLDNNVYEKAKSLENVIPISLSEIEEYCPELLSVKNSRQLKEYYATITPVVPLFLFDKYNINILFYTDADMAFWGNPNKIKEVMGDYSLMVTDHGFEPPRNNVRFNVGILGYRNDEYCKEFLTWWKNRCLEWCEWKTMPDGRCADQGYLNILYDEPDKFKNTLVNPHPGINMGPWNISKHKIVKKRGELFVDSIYNLICYHYHEFKMTGVNSYYSTGWKHTQSDKRLIYDTYFKLIKKIGGLLMVKKKLKKADWCLENIADANDELNRKYFETKEYLNLRPYTEIKEAFNWILERSEKNPLHAMDVGCGCGWQAIHFSLEGIIPNIVYSGSDISKAMCDRAAKNYPDGNFFVHDIVNNQFDKQYDIILEGAVLEIVVDWESSFRNMLRSSSNWVVIHRLWFVYEGQTRTEQVVTYHNIPDIRRHISLKELKSIAKDENFEMVRESIWARGYKMGTFIFRRVK